MAKVIASNISVKLNGGSPAIPGTWATSDGGGVTRERENSWDGGGTYDILVGKATAEDITVTRPYDQIVDDGWLNQLRRNMANGDPCEYSVAKQPLGLRNSPIGKGEVHPNCPVLSVRTYQSAAGAEAAAATIEIVLASKGPRNTA